jgi:hypothetical protein
MASRIFNSVSRSGHFAPRKRAPGTHWIGGWVGDRAGLNKVAKRKIPSPFRESNSGRSARSLITILTELSRLELLSVVVKLFYF